MKYALWIGNYGLQGGVPKVSLDADGGERITFKGAGNFSEGHRLLSKENIDVILLDLDLRDGSGLDFFLKIHGSVPEIPKIVITGQANRELAQKAVEKGAWGSLLREEISDPLLIKSIEHVFERKRLINKMTEMRSEINKSTQECTREIDYANSDLKRQLDDQQLKLEDLAKSESRYRKIVEELTYLIYYTTDINGYATYVNRPCAEITGYTMDELAGIHYLELIRPDWRAKGEELYRKQFKNRIRETTMNFPINTKSGEVKWIEQKVQLLMSDGYIQGFQGIGRDITDQKKAEDKLRTALNEKEVLIKEVHHRMKNNLLAISGLLHFQGASVKDESARRALHNCQRRIMSMAVIHEKLYQMEDLANVNIGDYIRTLADHLVSSFSASPDDITVNVPVNDIRLNVETAVPCGLIITELITNALEYAFPGPGKGKINIDLKEQKERNFVLTVSDNGVGLPSDLDIEKADSLGLLLTRSLVDSLGGTMEIDRKDGTTFTFRFTEHSEGRVEPIAELSPLG